VNSRTFFPLDALWKAGVKSNPAAGGSNQLAALEGCVAFLIQETMRDDRYAQMIILVALVVIVVNILKFISATMRCHLVG
jgi:hypothetical protein